MKTQRILVPVDGSEMSRFALGEADAIASQSGGQLTLMFVHAPATVHLMDDDFPEPAKMTEELLATARNCMQKLLKSLTIPEANRHIVVERCCSPPEAIVKHSKEYDLIVMSTHGHTGMKRLHLGSVAERVVRDALCDVLVVKQSAGTSDGAD